MKLVVRVKLMPEAAALVATLRTVNEAANWVSAVAFEQDVPREYELREHTYAELKARGLGAQAAQRSQGKGIGGVEEGVAGGCHSAQEMFRGLVLDGRHGCDQHTGQPRADHCAGKQDYWYRGDDARGDARREQPPQSRTGQGAACGRAVPWEVGSRTPVRPYARTPVRPYAPGGM